MVAALGGLITRRRFFVALLALFDLECQVKQVKDLTCQRTVFTIGQLLQPFAQM